MARGRLAALACAALLALHAALAWTALGTKSPTFDEPKHTLAASIALTQRDFRIDYDNPPLWKYWAALPNAAEPAHLDTNDPRWRALTSNLQRASEPGNVLLDVGEGNLPQQSVVVVSQICSVAKGHLGGRIGALSPARVEQILAGLGFQQRSFFER